MIPEPKPTATSREQIGALPVSQDAVWNALTTDPGTGVSIVTMTGKLFYVNEQAVRLFLGPDVSKKDVVGRSLHDLFPAKWAEERLAMFRRIIRTGKPIRFRSIWKGNQIVSWMHHIEAMNEEAMEDEETPSQAVPDRFLVISRRISGDPSKEAMLEGDSNYEIMDSEAVDLGPLDVLTPRELEVLALLGQGLSLKEIAATLFRSVKTVDNHRAAVGKKLAINDRIRLAEVALRAGLTLKDAERVRL